MSVIGLLSSIAGKKVRRHSSRRRPLTRGRVLRIETLERRLPLSTASPASALDFVDNTCQPVAADGAEMYVGTSDVDIASAPVRDFGDVPAPGVPEGTQTVPVAPVPAEPGDVVADPDSGEGTTTEDLDVPEIDDFTATKGQGDAWMFDGHVTYSMPWTLKIVFGGVLEGHETYPYADGSFFYSLSLPPGTYGSVSAQAVGPDGVVSEVTFEYI